MPVIKIYMDDEEFAPVARLAEKLNVKPQDIAFAGLNRVMLIAEDNELQTEIVDTRLWRSENLPRWADSARSVHAYEGKTDVHSHPRP